jgi:NO-binding membrane sensor protein with MHYT domain
MNVVWITVSVPIDLAIMSVPFRILRRTSLRQHEKRILRMIFGATLLGTVTWCVHHSFSLGSSITDG